MRCKFSRASLAVMVVTRRFSTLSTNVQTTFSLAAEVSDGESAKVSNDERTKLYTYTVSTDMYMNLVPGEVFFIALVRRVHGKFTRDVLGLSIMYNHVVHSYPFTSCFHFPR